MKKQKIEKEQKYMNFKKGTVNRVLKKVMERDSEVNLKRSWFSDYIQNLIEEDLK